MKDVIIALWEVWDPGVFCYFSFDSPLFYLPLVSSPSLWKCNTKSSPLKFYRNAFNRKALQLLY